LFKEDSNDVQEFTKPVLSHKQEATLKVCEIDEALNKAFANILETM